MIEKFYFISIVLSCLILGFVLGSYSPGLFNFTKKCYFSFVCSWEITNCCPETAGAKWECVNLKLFKRTECPEAVICPQVISPKPSKDCVCIEGSCVAE